MRKFLLFLSCLFAFPLLADSGLSCRKMAAELLVEHPKGACAEAEKALVLYPEVKLVYEMAIKCFAAACDEEKMLETWERYAARFPEKAFDQEILETLCWGILHKGEKSRGITSQAISLIGAALTQDPYAISFLVEGMRNTNAHIREISVELASLYGDFPLRQEILRLFKQETTKDVRIAVIKAIGTLKMASLFDDLVTLICDSKTQAPEKQAAVQALVNMQEFLDRKELQALTKSPRASLRLLASEVIGTYELKEQAELLVPLLEDSHPDVQMSALHALGILKAPLPEKVKKLAFEALEPLVAMTASWALLINDDEAGRSALKQWLFHKDEKIRVLAASTAAAAGPCGTRLAKEVLSLCEDPFVRANLAIALIGQREEIAGATEILDTFLQTHPGKLMWIEEGYFRVLQKSTLTHKPAIANYPEIRDQTARLELLNLLAICQYPRAQEAIKEFLKQRNYGVTGLAAETLLEEGDESAIELVRTLLSDPDRDVRFEAALVLATWGKDDTSLPTLLEMYPNADHELKIKILESISRISSKKAIPFLVERLNEPSLVLKMIAASVLIQTLNH